MIEYEIHKGLRTPKSLFFRVFFVLKKFFVQNYSFGDVEMTKSVTLVVSGACISITLLVRKTFLIKTMRNNIITLCLGVCLAFH